MPLPREIARRFDAASLEHDPASIAVVGADGAQIPVNIGGYDSVDGRTTIQLSMPGRICQRAVQAVVNVVIDVRSCAPGPGKQAAEIVKVISNNIR